MKLVPVNKVGNDGLESLSINGGSPVNYRKKSTFESVNLEKTEVNSTVMKSPKRSSSPKRSQRSVSPKRLLSPQRSSSPNNRIISPATSSLSKKFNTI